MRRRGFTAIELAIVLTISTVLVPLCFIFVRTVDSGLRRSLMRADAAAQKSAASAAQAQAAASRVEQAASDAKAAADRAEAIASKTIEEHHPMHHMRHHRAAAAAPAPDAGAAPADSGAPAPAPATP